jgi:hypothetical protein
MAARILGADQADEAARILRAGGLVGFPTDTVYGIAAQADGNFHSAKLQAFKGGRREPFALHVADAKTAIEAAGPLRELEQHVVSTLGQRRARVADRSARSGLQVPGAGGIHRRHQRQPARRAAADRPRAHR